jgi:hypothetical protein
MCLGQQCCWLLSRLPPGLPGPARPPRRPWFDKPRGFVREPPLLAVDPVWNRLAPGRSFRDYLTPPFVSRTLTTPPDWQTKDKGDADPSVSTPANTDGKALELFEGLVAFPLRPPANQEVTFVRQRPRLSNPLMKKVDGGRSKR